MGAVTGRELMSAADAGRTDSVRYGLTERRQAMLSGHAVVSHPGPMLRGMGIVSWVAEAV